MKLVKAGRLREKLGYGPGEARMARVTAPASEARPRPGRVTRGEASDFKAKKTWLTCTREGNSDSEFQPRNFGWKEPIQDKNRLKQMVTQVSTDSIIDFFLILNSNL